ncbi:MAG TPA: hypothetical protein VK107_03965 [Alloiococcus sp.]|nr:hypothetical protein [Alloiococcus sp.]
MDMEKVDIKIEGLRPTGEGTWYIDFKGSDPMNQIQLLKGYIPGVTDEEFFAMRSNSEYQDFVRMKLIERLEVKEDSEDEIEDTELDAE